MLLTHPDLPPAGAGESSIRPVAAALANAVFDAIPYLIGTSNVARSGRS